MKYVLKESLRTRTRISIPGSQFSSASTIGSRDVNKDLTPKDQDKDKDLTPRTRTRTRT